MCENRLSWIAPFVGAISLAFCAPVTAGPTIKVEQGERAQTVEVISDSAVALESVEPFSELFVANPDIADIASISGTTLYVLGKLPGRTTLMLISEDNSIISTIDIRVSPDVTELMRRLSEVLPDEEIDVLSAKDGLVLSGIVSSTDVIASALEVAGHYAQGRVSNLLKVEIAENAREPIVISEPVAVVEEAEPVDPEVVEAQLRAILPEEVVSVYEIAGTIVLSGTVSSEERAQQALQIARLAANGAEVSNLLSVLEVQPCNVRTRKGNELIETAIPCGKG